MKIKQKSELTFGRLVTAAYPAWRESLAGKPARNEGNAHPVALRAFDFFHERLARPNILKVLANRIKTGLAVVMLTALTGCIGFVGGGDYGGGGWWWDDGGWWGSGGGYDRGHDVHDYSARGAASRGAAHGGGGGVRAGGAGQAGGGGGHGGGGRR
jgi:hypothetical protein